MLRTQIRRTFSNTNHGNPRYPDQTRHRTKDIGNEQACSIITQLGMEKDVFLGLRAGTKSECTSHSEPDKPDGNRNQGDR